MSTQEGRHKTNYTNCMLFNHKSHTVVPIKQDPIWVCVLGEWTHIHINFDLFISAVMLLFFSACVVSFFRFPKKKWRKKLPIRLLIIWFRFKCVNLSVCSLQLVCFFASFLDIPIRTLFSKNSIRESWRQLHDGWILKQLSHLKHEILPKSEVKTAVKFVFHTNDSKLFKSVSSH